MKRTRRADKRALNQSAETLTMAAAMPLAAMITLGYRLPMLAGAMAGSGSWLEPEFKRMSEEKAKAGGEVALALGGAVIAGQQAIAGYGLAQMGANLNLMTSIPTKPMEAAAFGNASIQRLGRLLESLAEVGDRGLAKSLRPAHRAVTANARRLAGRKRRAAGT